MCGEKIWFSSVCVHSSGSPPRVRGKACSSLSIISLYGITPACAGKRTQGGIISMQDEDHPRVCGEKDQTKYQLTRGQGSPPRMRGKAVIAAGTRRAVRITPAYAGKSQPWRSYSQRRWDHPRVCGEKHTNISVRPIPPGSPPRMRGKDSPENKDISGRGITPAYAGKSFT